MSKLYVTSTSDAFSVHLDLPLWCPDIQYVMDMASLLEIDWRSSENMFKSLANCEELECRVGKSFTVNVDFTVTASSLCFHCPWQIFVARMVIALLQGPNTYTHHHSIRPICCFKLFQIM